MTPRGGEIALTRTRLLSARCRSWGPSTICNRHSWAARTANAIRTAARNRYGATPEVGPRGSPESSIGPARAREFRGSVLFTVPDRPEEEAPAVGGGRWAGRPELRG